MEIDSEPIRYYDEPGRLVVDLRREGVPFMPVASRRTGRCRTAAPRMHVHPGMVEICYCLRGSLAFETPEREYSFLPGCVFTSREDEPHRMKSNPKGLFVCRVLVAAGDGTRFCGLGDEDSLWLARRLRGLPRRFIVNGPELRDAFERLFRTYRGTFTDQVRRRIALRQAALGVLLECVDAAERGAKARRHRGVEEWVRRMESSPQEDYSLAEMSSAARLPQVAFVRAFKEIAGLAPHGYLRNCRIRAAAKLLEEGRSVLSVALRFKFRSAQYFATVFKAETGFTPRELKKRSK